MWQKQGSVAIHKATCRQGICQDQFHAPRSLPQPQAFCSTERKQKTKTSALQSNDEGSSFQGLSPRTSPQSKPEHPQAQGKGCPGHVPTVTMPNCLSQASFLLPSCSVTSCETPFCWLGRVLTGTYTHFQHPYAHRCVQAEGHY